MPLFDRVLIANRGEIAVRIIQACRDLGIETVLVVSDVDIDSMPAKISDSVVCIGPAQPVKSYLNINAIITAALQTGVNAVHPGYGFLAENPDFAECCIQNNLVFIGPRPQHIRDMGDKIVARRTVKNCGVPIIPGSMPINDKNEMLKIVKDMDFPILLKAAAGGGGKGMKIVENYYQLENCFQEASAEARSAFGDERIYVERFIPNSRHVEVQILADHNGRVLHLFERDCSAQRRYQKIIEEAPSPALTPKARLQICDAAMRIAESIGYESAGTVEFIYDQKENNFYFLEMNTRIQVEHPVTEAITGIDLIKKQIQIAAKEDILLNQEDININGHSIECRINAENPYKYFRPSPGTISEWMQPLDNSIRIDTHCFPGYKVLPFYDPLLAKLIVFGKNRKDSLAKLQKALKMFKVSGIETNMNFLMSLISTNEFQDGNINTQWVEKISQNMELI